MPQAANQSYLRAINQRLVLGAISQHGPISKAQLARMLKISKPAMADNVSILVAGGIVEELGEPEVAQGGGRKPTLLSLHKNHRYIATLDFSYNSSRFDLFDLAAAPISSFSVRQTPQQNFEAWVYMCKSALGTLLSAQGITPDQLAAIGISSPGIISASPDDILPGQVYGAFDPKALLQSLKKEFPCPIYMKNSTNASALGECECGAGRESRNLIYISCGQGLGAGVIIDRKLYEGSRLAAGEIAGFITPQTMALSQSLEQRICIEGLLDRYTAHHPDAKVMAGQREALFEHLVVLLRSGDLFMRQCVQDIAVELGCLICNLIMAFNCDMVVLGGEYLVFAQQMLPVIRDMIQKHCIVPAELVAAQLEDRTSSQGMAVICREMYFDSVCEVKQTSD